MSQVIVVYSDLKYNSSFRETVAIVASEKKYLASVDGFSEEESLKFVEEIVRNGWAQYYAIDDSRVVGWCDVIPIRITGFTHVGRLGMGILKEYRHIGLGTELIEKTISHARDKNRVEKVELDVFESNTNAIGLYKKTGFFEEGKRTRERKLDGEYDNMILMGKFL